VTETERAEVLERIGIANRNTLVEHLGIEIIEVGEGYLRGRMPVDHRTHQQMGLLHGGASMVLAETLGSIGGMQYIDSTSQAVVGVEINGNHLKSARSGFVYGIARPLRTGRTLHVWSVEISDEEGDMVCICRLTLAVVSRKHAAR
jgi:1,4-dihydroxy-2-naphthoyl-CoA hydrolase